MANFDNKEMLARLKRLETQTPRAITAVVGRTASEGEQYMKTSAPWHDDTGAARSGLRGRDSHPAEDRWEILLAHSVKYGIFLEVCNHAKYAIILPSLRWTGDALKRNLSGMWGKLK
jgi:hypothetical protein